MSWVQHMFLNYTLLIHELPLISSFFLFFPSQTGAVIYVVESMSWVQHMFLNYTLLFHDLPLAAATFRLWIVPYVSFMWPIWLVVRLLTCVSLPAEDLHR